MLRTLYTPWEPGEKPVYPRPQCRRESFLPLDGRWDFAVSPGPALPAEYDRTIRVPFCPESPLSGIGTHFPEGSYLFYRRRLTLPPGFRRDRVLLHIGAADQKLDLYVNGRHLGSHEGGYSAMTFDITKALAPENCLELRVWDDLRSPVLPYGKQTQTPGGMWYTPVSGVWQSVWLESVPEGYIAQLDLEIQGDTVLLDTGDPAHSGWVRVQTPQGEEVFPLEKGRAVLSPKAVRRWSPEDPYLYEITVDTGTDRVESYFALRTLEIRTVAGLPRLCLNGKPYFFHGLLDQGYWSDGLLTPPSPQCYAWDIQRMKELGFNTLRKHIKVEPEEFYYQCDRLGMVVFQDMVNNGDYAYVRDTALPTLGFQRKRDRNLHRDPTARAAFYDAMEATVKQLKNHPCIAYWTIFNEGWGQFDATAAYRRLKTLDGSRFIDSTSGWFRGGETDVDSRHIYFGQWWQLRPSRKPTVLSEFGGFCYGVEGHMACPEKAYGYRTCQTLSDYQEALEEVYRKHILPAVRRGLCAAIYTQVSDVEEEINGLVTYDRRVVKAEKAPMQALARALQAAVSQPAVQEIV